jgi:hypothetical protein
VAKILLDHFSTHFAGGEAILGMGREGQGPKSSCSPTRRTLSAEVRAAKLRRRHSGERYMDWSWWQIAVLGAIGFGSYCLILIAKQLEQTNKLLREQSDELRKIENTVSILQIEINTFEHAKAKARGEDWSADLDNLLEQARQKLKPSPKP